MILPCEPAPTFPMPTNILRARSSSSRLAAGGRGHERATGPRQILIAAGRARLRIALLDTPTAERIWRALPLHSTAETWGMSVHFELPIENGRERGTRVNGHKGEIYFWSEDDRVLIAFGPTPISRDGEIRLPRPCNVWAHALDDTATLAAVRPGEKVVMTALPAVAQGGAHA